MFNVNQQKAIDSNAKTILCNAAAGSGKTTVLIERIYRLNAEEDVKFENVLCLTFTRLAGREMKERMLQRNPEADSLFANTFHALGVQMIKDYGHHIGMEENFSIYDQDDEKDIINMVLDNSGSKITLKKYYKFLMDELEDHREKIACARIKDEFYAILRENNAVHFEGILDVMIQLLQIDEVREYYHNQYQYLFIDETQDTNKRQFEIIKLIAADNLFLVGDVNQSIYSWRGANPQQFVDVVDNYDDVEVILMNDNYRSTHQIVNGANKLMSKVETPFDASMISHKDGEHIEFKTYKTGKDEIWCTILDIVDRYPVEQFKNVAILTKKNSTLVQFAELCDSKKIPYLLLSNSNDPMKTDQVKHLLSMIRIANNKRDIFSLKKILISVGVTQHEILELENLSHSSGMEMYDVIKASSNEKISKIMNIIGKIETGSLSNIKRTFDHLLSLTGYVKELKSKGRVTKADSVMEARDIIFNWSMRREFRNWRVDVDSFLKWIMLRDIREKNKDEKEGIRLLTFHGSKGLEFDHVYILDCAEGQIPDLRGDTVEQFNLMYVAMTRAKEILTIGYAETKKVRYHSNAPWMTKEQTPSRYIDFIRELSLF